VIGEYNIAEIFVTGACVNYRPRFFHRRSFIFSIEKFAEPWKWLGYLARDFGAWCLEYIPCQKVSAWFSHGLRHSAWSSRFWYFTCRPLWYFCSDLKHIWTFHFIHAQL